MQAIDVRNLKFNNVFDNLSFEVTEGSFATILGNNASGKTTLTKILGGFVNYKGEVFFFKKKAFQKQKKVAVIFEDSFYNDGLVMDLFIKKMKGQDKKIILDKVTDLAHEFMFFDYLNEYYEDLTYEMKILVTLGLALALKPKILILDDIFNGVDNSFKLKVLKKLTKRVKMNKLTLIMMTMDSEDLLLSDKTIVIDEGKVWLAGVSKEVLEDERFLDNEKFGLPFMVNLSNKLRFYDLTGKFYYDDLKLVNDLWK